MGKHSHQKSHKTPWGKVKDIIQTRKDSLKKRQRHAKADSGSKGASEAGPSDHEEEPEAPRDSPDEADIYGGCVEFLAFWLQYFHVCVDVSFSTHKSISQHIYSLTLHYERTHTVNKRRQDQQRPVPKMTENRSKPVNKTKTSPMKQQPRIEVSLEGATSRRQHGKISTSSLDGHLQAAADSPTSRRLTPVLTITLPSTEELRGPQADQPLPRKPPPSPQSEDRLHKISTASAPAAPTPPRSHDQDDSAAKSEHCKRQVRVLAQVVFTHIAKIFSLFRISPDRWTTMTLRCRKIGTKLLQGSMAIMAAVQVIVCATLARFCEISILSSRSKKREHKQFIS
ncbi:hypothetical protein ANN_16381 [Periplaneta americana]|uniref:Uncharacterized protein n=1 Tax=Periplaneta americana TaxID=6978 RepID=A0ABQ8SK67_PERAM|nr:hypothetical protein ANN_16381 [Periplaneta americana]